MRDHKDSSLKFVRVLSDRIRRVVLVPGLRSQFHPGMVFFRDGNRLGFVSIRWRAESVILLTKDGTRTARLSDIAEVHMPRTDPWEAYYRELAVLSPNVRSQLIRIETTDGMIATGSESRFSAVPFGHETILPNANAHRRNLNRHIERLKDQGLKSRRKFEANLARLVQAKTALEPAVTRLKASAARQNAAQLSQMASARARLDALPGPEGNPGTWYHMAQPVWSLDSLWVPFETILMRWSFPPDKILLSRIPPTDTVSPSTLRWRADRNVDGGPLRSGGRLHGWGFGVHAYSELAFTLPPAAISFRSRLGLDRFAETGGCVRGKVFLGSTKTKPVYESPLLIGSGKTVETGVIRITSVPKAPINLILQADPASRNHPPQADPLNIRDKLDWLEPQLGLDPGRLGKEVSRYIGPSVVAWRRWRATLDKRGVYTWRSWLVRPVRHERERFLPVLRVASHPLKLSRAMTIPAGDKWLVVDVRFTDGRGIDTKVVTLRIGGREIPAEKLPVRQYWRRRTAPLVYSVEKYRGKEVKLELTQQPDGKELCWWGIGTSKMLPVHYRLARFLEAVGRKDMEVTRGLGLALQSGRIGKHDAMSALRIMRLGGTIGFCCKTEERDHEFMHCVMIPHDWVGGEKTFSELKNVPWLRFLIVCQETGISNKAIKDVATARKAGVWLPRRTPSTFGGISCVLTIRNRSAKDVVVFQVNRGGGFQGFDQIKPGGERKLHSHEGFRYEAYAVAKNYAKSEPVSRVLVKGDIVWEIK
jgi:hypothetical protein